MHKKIALIAGATGIIGSHILNHLNTLDDWEVFGIARNIPTTNSNLYLNMDLLNVDDIKSKLRQLGEVTHIFYAAYQDYPAVSKEQIEINTGMLSNLVNAVEATSASFERVVLMQGAKVYGAHLGKFKTPAKETDPRHMPPNFYYSQEDFLRSHRQGKNWAWTILRPDLVAGLSIGNPMNITMVIAVYAAISKELGLPLRFPGKEGAFKALVQITDASLLARASVWAATQENTALEIFNITNGDLFRWEYIWPKFAKYFDMEYAPIQTIPLSEMMPLQQELWSRMVEKYDLQKIPYHKIAAWPFADFIFGSEYDVITDTTKIKKFGFNEVIDSEDNFLVLFDSFKKNRLIPS